MIEIELVVRIMVGLIGAVYGLIGYIEQRESLRVSSVVFAVIGGLPLFAWTFRPEIFSIASIEIPLLVRRIGLVAGAGAVLTRYRSIRPARDGDDGPRTIPVGWHYAGLSLLVVSIALGTANWLVGSAVALAVALTVVTLFAASRRGPSEPPRHRPDS